MIITNGISEILSSIDIPSTVRIWFLHPGYLLIAILSIMLLSSIIITIFSFRIITKGIVVKGLTAVRRYIKILYFRVLIEKLTYTIAIGILYVLGLMKVSQEKLTLMTFGNASTTSLVTNIIYFALLGWLYLDHFNRLSGWRKRANETRTNVLYLIAALETDNLVKTLQYKNKFSEFLSGANKQLETQASSLIKGEIEIMGHIKLDILSHIIKFRLIVIIYIVTVFSLKW